MDHETPFGRKIYYGLRNFGLAGVTAKIEQLERSTGSKMAAFEDRITRNLENMELRIVQRLESLETDVAKLNARSM